MKNMIRFAFVTGLLAVAISSSIAQSTDIVQRANFVLKGTAQIPSGSTSIRVVNKDIIAALNETGAFRFSSKATLLFVNSDDQPPVLVVQDLSAGQTTNTDVSGYFDVTEIGDEVHARNESTSWQTWRFGFDNGNTNETAFQLWGLTTIHRGTIRTRGVGTLAGPQRVQSKVNGVGRVRGMITVFSGTVSGANTILVQENEP